MADVELSGGLRTAWGEAKLPDCPLGEYPRPQFMRPKWLCLNGLWDFEVLPKGQRPEEYGDRILVPFSPETALSGARGGPGPGETGWYRRRFALPAGFMKDRLLLHFGAVDQSCEVFMNGRSAGTHEGGYTPFTLDVTALASPTGPNTLTVAVRDETSEGACVYGKQSLRPGGIWYTAQSGIWQTVWLESVPEKHFTGIRITPREGKRVELQLPDPQEGDAFAVFRSGRRVLNGEFDLRGRAEFTLPDGILWTPENPFLYDLLIKRGSDVVKCYFALRTVRAEKGQLLLNGEPVFLTGLLDQGYWPESLYTPPSDEAMIYDIETAKSLGFNLLRKHVKVEPARWYYHCDRLGMLVWQDDRNGGAPYSFMWTALLPFLGIQVSDGSYGRFGRRYERARRQFLRETEEIVQALYNSPCVIAWTLFNEGWGQFDAVKLTAKLKEWDPTRCVDSASGWHDQHTGDFCSTHRYFGKQRLKSDPRVQAVTEFGGCSLTLAGHAAPGRGMPYRRVKSGRELTAALEKLIREQILPLKEEGLRACIYTQLSDVEGEHNGLLTWDRKVLKPDAARLLALNEELKAPAGTAPEAGPEAAEGPVQEAAQEERSDA